MPCFWWSWSYSLDSIYATTSALIDKLVKQINAHSYHLYSQVNYHQWVVDNEVVIQLFRLEINSLTVSDLNLVTKNNYNWRSSLPTRPSSLVIPSVSMLITRPTRWTSATHKTRLSLWVFVGVLVPPHRFQSHDLTHVEICRLGKNVWCAVVECCNQTVTYMIEFFFSIT